MDYLNETFTGSQQNNTDKHDYWKKSTFSLKSILPAYLIILLICLTGNCLVCLTVWRNKNMRSRWYSLLVTLSVADMGLALTTPIQLLQFANVDIGDAGCKCSIFVLDVFFGTGMLVLAYLSLDRYHGICRPPLKVGERRVRAAIILPLIWLAISLTYAPMLFACRRSTKAGSLSCDCHTAWPKEEHYVVYSFFIVFATYIMPFSTMSLCYYKICQNLWKNTKENSVLPSADPTGSKRRSIKMLIITTAFFFACWTPYNCLYVLKKLKLVSPKTLGKLWLFSQVLGFANSAWNPFIYCIFSKNFRRGFKSAFSCCKRWNRGTKSVSNCSGKGTQSAKGSRSRTITDTGYGSSTLSVTQGIQQASTIP